MNSKMTKTTWILGLLLIISLINAANPAVGSYQSVDDFTNQSTGRAPLKCTQPDSADDILDSCDDTVQTPLFYGYIALDPTLELPQGPCSFSPSTPDNITSLGFTDSTSFIAGATMAHGCWWGCEYNHDTVANTANIWKINTTTGNMTLVGKYDPDNTDISFNGMSYDAHTDIMYACDSRSLYTVDMNTGASTFLGNIIASDTINIIGIAFDNMGTLYAEDIVHDKLYIINLTTMKATAVGELGIDICYAQDMAFDHFSQTMYLSACVLGGIHGWEGALYTVNLSTGAATRVGKFQGNADITGFAIPFVPVLELSKPVGGVGFRLSLKNIGFADAKNVEWAIIFNDGGVLLPFDGEKRGTIPVLALNEEKIFGSMVFGIGGLLEPWNITISAQADNAAPVYLTVQAKLLLFFMILI